MPPSLANLAPLSTGRGDDLRASDDVLPAIVSGLKSPAQLSAAGAPAASSAIDDLAVNHAAAAPAVQFEFQTKGLSAAERLERWPRASAAFTAAIVRGMGSQLTAQLAGCMGAQLTADLVGSMGSELTGKQLLLRSLLYYHYFMWKPQSRYQYDSRKEAQSDVN